MQDKEVSFKSWELSPKLKKLADMYVSQDFICGFHPVVEEAIRNVAKEIAPGFYHDLEKEIVDPSISTLHNLGNIIVRIQEMEDANTKEKDTFDPRDLAFREYMIAKQSGKMTQEIKDKFLSSQEISDIEENKKKVRLCEVNGMFLFQLYQYALNLAARALLDSIE